MAQGGNGNDYHSLLSLHHALRLRRHLRGATEAAPAAGNHPNSGAARPGIDAPTPASWPQRRSDQRLLQESLAILDPLEDTLLKFYTALLRDRPYLRSLFPESIMAQRERLKSSFLRLIDALDRLETIVPAIEALGRDHRKFGVRPPHYTAFADALIEALRAAGGDRWCDEYEQAWLRLYWFTAKLMIDAAEQVTSEPPYTDAVVTDHERRRSDLAVVRLHTMQPYQFEAGQHTTLQSPRMPRTWRSYSMANPPSDDGLLEFHVRAKGVGGLSDVLVKDTRPGDVLRLGPPRGNATLSWAAPGDLLLVAGGTGLAPIKSILGAVGRAPARPRTSLFIGARSQDDLYDIDFLAKYAEHSPWLRLVPAISDERAFRYETGLLPDVVARFGPWNGCTAFVAGPREMVTTLLHRLPELGVPAERIAHEPE